MTLLTVSGSRPVCAEPGSACRLPPAACRLPPAACRLPPAATIQHLPPRSHRHSPATSLDSPVLWSEFSGHRRGRRISPRSSNRHRNGRPRIVGSGIGPLGNHIDAGADRADGRPWAPHTPSGRQSRDPCPPP